MFKRFFKKETNKSNLEIEVDFDIKDAIKQIQKLTKCFELLIKAIKEATVKMEKLKKLTE